MESDGSPSPGDLAADLSRVIARLGDSQEAVVSTLAQRQRIDPATVKDAFTSIRKAIELLDRASATLTALDWPEASIPTTNPVDGWAWAVAAAIEQANPVSLRELAEQPPDAIPPMIVMAARAAAAGDWDAGRSLPDYVLGRIVGMGSSPELGRIACATAVLAARVWMIQGGAPQRCQGYLQLAQSYGGTAARLEAALAQMQRTTEDLGLAQDSAVHACSLDPGFPRGHVERALALAAGGSDPSEAVETAARTASARDHPYEALTDLVGDVPDAIALHLAQICQASRPEVARRALDELIMAAEPRLLSPGESRQETSLRLAEAYQLRAALPRTSGAGGPDADAVTADSSSDLYYAAVLASEFDGKLSNELLKQILTGHPQDREAHLLLSDLLRVQAEQAVPPSVDLLDEAALQLELAQQSPAPARNAEWERRIRAAVLMTQASARPQGALGRLLKAALQLERSVLDDTASTWLYLVQSRLFSRLDMWSWARTALEKASQRSPDDPALREERILLDINSGAYEAVVERVTGPALPEWSRAVRALALAELGQATAAVELLVPLVSQADAPLWYRTALARAYFLDRQYEAARAQLEDIAAAERIEWPQDDKQATALLRLGRLEEAEKLLRTWEPEPSDHAGRQWRLALCRLARDPGEARGLLLAGLEAEALPSALRNAYWEFDVVRQAVEQMDVDDSRRAEALAALREAGELVDRRLRNPLPMPDRQAELRRCLELWLTILGESAGASSDDISAARALAGALTARLATEQFADARDLALYADLRGSALDDVVPDTLRRRSAEVRAEIVAAISRQDYEQARTLYQALVAVAGDPVPPGLTALGVALAVRQGDLDGIRQACAQALAAASSPAGAAQSVLSADIPVDRETLLRGLAAAATAVEGAEEGTDGAAASIAPRPAPASILFAAVSAEIGRLALEDIARSAPASYDIRPLVAELGEALVPEDTSATWKLFSRDIPAMRDRVKDRLGLDLPGILVRYGALDAYAFRILLDGLEVMRGELVPHEDAGKVPAPERLEVVTEAIERTVWAAPGSFLTLNQLELLVRQAPVFWADATPDPRAAAELIDLTASPKTMVRLTGVLRALLDDGLHVRELADLLMLIQRASSPGEGHADVRRRIRSKASGHLVAARPGARGVRLPEDLERAASAAAESAPASSGPAEIIDLLVRTWPEVLQTCRADEMPVIVVTGEPARTWLQQVLRDLLLPGVAVTAAEVPDLTADVPSSWRSLQPVTLRAEPRPLLESQ